MYLPTLCIAFIGLLATTTSQDISGTISANPSGGQVVNAVLSKRFGDEEANVGGGLFARGSTNGGPVTTGGFLDANKNGHGLSIMQSNTPGFGSTLQEKAHVNLFNQDEHRLDANAFHSRTSLDNGFKFDRVGGGLDYNHAAGHGASLGVSHIPKLDMNTVDLNARANLWRSLDRQTTLDLNGGISKNYGGPLDGNVNSNIGLGLTHRFGKKH